MTAEQKQRAADLLAAWRATAYALHGDRMAYRTTTGRAAIVQTLAEVTLVPQWSDAQ